MTTETTISRIRGTHDWLDLKLYNFVLTEVEKHLALYDFTQIATPLIESTHLFKRSLGLQTDVVSKEMFTITPHAESSEDICLRPEATASVMRAFLENKSAITTPWSVYLHGPMFRYERPQKGRFRQFHQINIETIGIDSTTIDVQFAVLLERLFAERFGLQNYALRINFLGCSSDRQIARAQLNQFLESHASKLCQTCLVRKDKNILRVFDCKNSACQEIYQTAPRILDHLCTTCKTEWEQIKSNLELLSVSYSIDSLLVRGLDYYDKLVFEFSSEQLGSQTAFCGGGRYNGLAQQLGAQHAVPAIGAAIGIERLMLLLQENQTPLKLSSSPPLFAVIPFETAQHQLGLLIADQMRANELRTELIIQKTPKSAFKHADKLGVQTAVIIGSDEVAQGTLTIKNMRTGQQNSIRQEKLIATLNEHMTI